MQISLTEQASKELERILENSPVKVPHAFLRTLFDSFEFEETLDATTKDAVYHALCDSTDSLSEELKTLQSELDASLHPPVPLVDIEISEEMAKELGDSPFEVVEGNRLIFYNENEIRAFYQQMKEDEYLADCLKHLRNLVGDFLGELCMYRLDERQFMVVQAALNFKRKTLDDQSPAYRYNQDVLETIMENNVLGPEDKSYLTSCLIEFATSMVQQSVFIANFAADLRS